MFCVWRKADRVWCGRRGLLLTGSNRRVPPARRRAAELTRRGAALRIAIHLILLLTDISTPSLRSLQTSCINWCPFFCYSLQNSSVVLMFYIYSTFWIFSSLSRFTLLLNITSLRIFLVLDMRIKVNSRKLLIQQLL